MSWSGVLLKGFLFVRYFWRPLLGYSWVPALGLGLISYILPPNPGLIAFALYAVLGLAFHTLLGMAVQSLVLNQKVDRNPFLPPRWTNQATRYLGFLILVPLCTVPIALAFAFLPLGSFVSAILSCWLLSWLSLVFPALVSGEQVSFRDVWQLSQGNHAGLFATIFFTTIVAQVLATLILVFIPMEGFSSGIASIAISIPLAIISALNYQELTSNGTGD